MKISNIRIERKDGFSFLTVDVEANYTDNNKLWFSVPSEYEDYLTDEVYDAFLIAAIYPAMYYHENIEIEGKVSPKLYDNVVRYIPSIVTTYRPEMTVQKIKVQGFAKAKKTDSIAATGFSAGIDSFSTFIDRCVEEPIDEYKVRALFFFNVGSHGGGGEKARKVFNMRYDLLKPFTDEVALPYIKLDSNLFDFYIDKWEYDAGQFCRAAAILLLQRKVSRYYISNTHTYSEIMKYTMPFTVDLTSIVETYMNPLMSTEGIELITDGAQATRSVKTEKVLKYEPSQRYLNVCVNHWSGGDTASNCSMCSKCLRTLIAIEALGKLDDYKNVFDIEKYKTISYAYKCQLVLGYNNDVYYRDNVDFAIAHGLHLPSFFEAYMYMFPRKIKGKCLGVAYKLYRLIKK